MLGKEEIEKELSSSRLWRYDENSNCLICEITTNNFKETVLIVNLICGLSEAHFHHPDVEFGYKKIKVKLMTHSEKCVTYKDIDLAKDIERFVTKIVKVGM